MIFLTYVIIHTTNEKYIKSRLINLKKTHPELFVLNIGSCTWVMRNNGMSLSYMAHLLEKYPNEVYAWVAERITLRQFPKECIKGGNWLRQKDRRRLIDVPKYLGISKEELEKCKIKYSLSLSE